MCIIAAKYLKDKGWVLVKNRDQDYVSEITFLDENHPKVGEVMCLYDHNTKYKEGMNYLGMSIITTSLTPLVLDETNKKDGDAIYKALSLDTLEAAAKYITGQKITGFIFISNKDTLILIEAARKDQGKGDYKFTQRVIPKSEIVVRTNHGIDLPWAGFQTGYTEQQDIWRKSSELRKKYAEEAVKNSTDPIDMLDAFSTKMDNDLQMNLFRVESKPRQMRTIFQWALVPSEDTVYIRPIQSKMKIKIDLERIKVIMLDNEPIKKIYKGKIKHFCRIVQQGEFFKTIQLESFKEFFKNA
jgi:hypothetical protein